MNMDFFEFDPIDRSAVDQVIAQERRKKKMENETEVKRLFTESPIKDMREDAAFVNEVKTDDELAEELRHQDHYDKATIQPWDYIAAQELNFDLGNVVKYVSRAGKKDGESKLKDLLKARNYIDHEISKLKREDTM